MRASPTATSSYRSPPGLFVDPDPGPVLANYGIDNLRFLSPVFPGDALSVTLTCKQKNPRVTENYGEVRWDTTVTNQDGKVVAQYDVLTMVKKLPQPDPLATAVHAREGVAA